MALVTRLNHAVLYVSDVERSAQFYKQAFGFVEVDRMGDRAVFLRSGAEPAASGEAANHHDLAVMSVGASAPRPPRGSTGLYHLAWEVATIEELADTMRALVELDAITGASDHGVSKSLYGEDPDGIEFEVMWRVPAEAWGDYATKAVVMPLDMQREIARFGNKVKS